MIDEQRVTIKQGEGRQAKKITVVIPSNARLVEAALELKAHSGGERTCGCYEPTCIGLYTPPQKYMIREEDLFTGKQGATRDGGIINEFCWFYHFDGHLTPVAFTSFNTDPLSICLLGKSKAKEQLDLFPLSEAIPAFEGAKSIVEQTRYERDSVLRAICIGHHGASCIACGMSFGEIYGHTGTSYIHVHHLVPLSTVGKSHIVDPIKDLVPVCPNCHAVIHLKNPPYTPSQVHDMIQSSRSMETNDE